MTASTKVNRDVLIDTILHERDGLRAELIEYEKSMHRSIFAFVAIGGVAMSIHFNKGAASNFTDGPILLFLLSQIEFFLSLFGMALIAGQSMHAGYISALEKKLNELAGATASIWESEIVPHYMMHPRGSFFFANLLLTFFSIAIFLAFVYLVISAASTNIEKIIYGVILIVELVVTIVIYVWSQLDTKRVARFAESRFSSGS